MNRRGKYFNTLFILLFLGILSPSSSAQNEGNPPAPEILAPAEESPEEISEEALNALLGQAQPIGLTDVEASHYTLGPTDVIDISVMRHPEVSGPFILNMEGKIQYQFVGDVKIAGKTKDEAAEMIREALTEYIISPEVTVKITGYNSKVVYVVGEVGSPGKVFMHGNTITVREALIQAGLPLLSGITKKSRLITPSTEGKRARQYVNVYALLYDGDLRENLDMNPGDVLYIPPTFLTKTMRAITPVAAPIGTAAGTSGASRTLTGGF
jgi:polysaccharide export outer membrane protein